MVFMRPSLAVLLALSAQLSSTALAGGKLGPLIQALSKRISPVQQDVKKPDFEREGAGGAVVATDSRLNATKSCSWGSYRLPATVLPDAYRLTLQTILVENSAVAGSVEIDVHATEPVHCVVLHAVGMTISQISAISIDGSEQPGHYISDSTLSGNDQFAIYFDSPIETSATLLLQFNYTLQHKHTGYFLTPYTAGDGTKTFLGTTHMQAVYTRQAFPCFDEPWMKATFQLSVLTDPSVPVVLFNAPRLNGTRGTPTGYGLVRWDFEATPVMSSYLVAFALGNLTSMTATVPGTSPEQDIDINLWTTLDRIDNFHWALESAAAILPCLEALFDYPYFLPKLDILALPEYTFEAMENWGLLIYRQTRIEIDPGESPHSIRYFLVADTIAHEMTHLWCGDLVTMTWWSDLWLNEASATNFEFFASDYASQALQGVSTYFYTEAGINPFHDDFAGGTQHPISDPSNADAESDREVQALFDDIEYAKGGAVLRMLWNYMSSDHYDGVRLPANVPLGHDIYEDNVTQADTQRDPFIECYRAWLKQKAFSTGTGADFLASFSNTSGSLINEWMHQWIYQPGYPIVMVEADANGTVVAHQASFNLQGLPWRCNPNATWWIPLSYKAAEHDDLQWTTLTGCATVPIGQLQGGNREFLKVNVNQSGYWRTQYSHNLWLANAREAGANDSALSQSDVAGLLDDAHALHQIEGAINITVYLELLRALGARGKLEYVPWSLVDDQLPAMAYYLGSQCGTALYSFIASDVTGAFANLPLDCSTMNGANDRAAANPMLDIAAIGLNQGLSTNALNVSLAATNGGPNLDPDLANNIVQLALASGQESAFRQVLEEYRQAGHGARGMYASILAYSPNTDLLNATLYEALQQQSYSLADLQNLASAFANQRPAGRDLAWEFFTGNKAAILEKGGGNVRQSWGPFLKGIGSMFTDTRGQALVDSLWADIKDQMGSDIPYRAAISSIQTAMAWLEQYGDDGCAWLTERVLKRAG